MVFVPDNPPKCWKRKYGAFCWDGDDLYVSPAIAGLSDMGAILFIGAEANGKILQFNEFILVAEKWLYEEFPKKRTTLSKVKEIALKNKVAS